jgi:hypothetical protein
MVNRAKWLVPLVLFSACAAAPSRTPLPRVVFVPGAGRERRGPLTELPAINGTVLDGNNLPRRHAEIFITAVDERGLPIPWEGGHSFR